MGLDMYLYAERYFSGYVFSHEPDRDGYRRTLEAAGLVSLASDQSPTTWVRTTAVYWRKANAIHAWFVDQLQDGVDECQLTHVPREKLEELRDLCRDALRTRAPSKLPPRAGFFFGSTDVDEWYWEDLQITADELTRVLEATRDSGVDFYYRSSW